jgi:hypothetical protein
MYRDATMQDSYVVIPKLHSGFAYGNLTTVLY